MKIPISSNTICGNNANNKTGIIPNSANIHKTAYIIIKIPTRRAILYR